MVRGELQIKKNLNWHARVRARPCTSTQNATHHWTKSSFKGHVRTRTSSPITLFRNMVALLRRTQPTTGLKVSRRKRGQGLDRTYANDVEWPIMPRPRSGLCLAHASHKKFPSLFFFFWRRGETKWTILKRSTHHQNWLASIAEARDLAWWLSSFS